MNTKIVKFDINKNLYDTLKAKQGDTKSRFLLFQLLDSSVPFSLVDRSVRVYAIKPDGKEVFNDLIINNAALGYCTLELTNQVLAVQGNVKLELMVMEGDKKLTSNVFNLDVLHSINSEKAIVSTNEFGALLSALNKINKYVEEFEDKSGKIEELYTPRLNELGSQLETIYNKKADKNTTANLQNQINSLVINGTGNSNPEVIQARSGISGALYNTLKDRIDILENAVEYGIFDGVTWSVGTIDNNGLEAISTVRLRSDIIIFPQNTTVTIIPSTGYKFSCYFYDSNNVFASKTNFLTETSNITIGANNHCRLVLSKIDDTTISLIDTNKISLPIRHETNINKDINILNSSLKYIDNDIYTNVSSPIGTFINGTVEANDTISSNNNRASIIKIPFSVNDVIKFDNNLFNKYKFAIDKSGDNQSQWIPSKNGAYHSEDYTFIENANYNIMVAKLDNTDITQSELDEISSGLIVTKKVIKFKNDSNKLIGKKIGVIGDSFVKGHTLSDCQTWLYKLAKRNTMEHYNYGINGNDLSGSNGVASRYSTMVDGLDYVVVLAGHNDANPDLHGGSPVPIGVNSDNTLTTYKGALNILIKGLLNKYPKSNILFLSPFNRKTIELPYVKAMEEICELYSVPFFNNYKSSGICFQNDTQLSVYDLEGSKHLNELGQERISCKYENVIKTM